MTKHKDTWVSRTDFSAQYKAPQWQKRRLERLDRAGWECESCGDKESQLHVHHVKYVSGRKVWEYSDDDLQVLCETCHERTHADAARLKELLAQLPRSDIGTVIGYVMAKVALSQMDLDENAVLRPTNYEEAVGVACCLGIDERDVILKIIDDGDVRIADLWAIRLASSVGVERG